ncbi:MAG: hypothetical protein JWN70_2618 [Planctomycetaceae bacterium]|nr:hypothetical protein [Planctomycetaceae bacterium]
MMTRSSLTRGVRLLICLVPVSIGLVGCGGGAGARKLPMSSVSGKVTYKNQALPAGQIVFEHTSGEIVAATLGKAGEYSLEVPVGANRVMVKSSEPDQPNPDPNGMPRTLPGKSRIPDKYMSFGGSGLSFTPVAGKNTYDVALTN